MKKLFALAAVALICAAAGEIMLAGVDAPTWNAARKKFYREFDDQEKLPGLISEMGELNDRRAVELLCKKTLFHEDFDVRTHTFDVLSGTTDPDAVKYLAEQVRRDEKNRLMYVRLLQYISGEKVADNIKRALGDKRWQVVSAALEAARRHKDSSLQDALKRKLNDKNPRLAYEAALAYAACGGEMPARFKTPPVDGVLPSKVFANKCLVLFDTSDDMLVRMALPTHAMKEVAAALKHRMKGKEYEVLMGKLKENPPSERYEEYCVTTRRVYCAESVVRMLATLEPSSQANIVVYSAAPAFWEKKFQKMNKKNVADLRRFLGDVMTRPARDLNDALRKAVNVEDVDTIFIVTCGLPAGARVEDTDYILSWLREKNYESGIQIHTTVVLSNYVDGKPSEEGKLAFDRSREPVLDFYRKIAQQNGGEFRFVADLGSVSIPDIDAPPKKEEPAKEEPEKEQPEKKEPVEKQPEKKEPEKKEPEKKTEKDEPKKEEPEKQPEKPPKKKPKKDDDWLPKG